MGDGNEWVQGAFVLPNEPIPDERASRASACPVRPPSSGSVLPPLARSTL